MFIILVNHKINLQLNLFLTASATSLNEIASPVPTLKIPEISSLFKNHISTFMQSFTYIKSLFCRPFPTIVRGLLDSFCLKNIKVIMNLIFFFVVVYIQINNSYVYEGSLVNSTGTTRD